MSVSVSIIIPNSGNKRQWCSVNNRIWYSYRIWICMCPVCALASPIINQCNDVGHGVWKWYSNKRMFHVRPGGMRHGLSQQGVWVPFWTPKPLKMTPQDTQFFLWGISKNLNLKLIIEFFHPLMIPMTLFNDIMPYFDESIHVYD